MRFKSYLFYRLFSSMFFGFSTGSIFIIYEPLQPLIYSLGGILLAVGTMIIASQYKKLMNKRALFIVLFAVEIVTLAIVLTFLILGKSLLSALIIYICYQITFLFGSYVIRVETVVLKHTNLYSLLDMSKQIGYLAGLGGAFFYYELIEIGGILDKIAQVYFLHYILVVLQCVVILLLIISFMRKK